MTAISKVSVMNKQAILQYVDKKYQKKEAPSFRVGDTVRVHVRITEGDSTRVQIFEGVMIGFGGQGGSRNFTVRKISFGVGVERCFPSMSPNIDKVEVVRSGHARRAKLYYLRNRVGRAAKLDEKGATSESSKKAASDSAVPAQQMPSSKEELVVAEGS